MFKEHLRNVICCGDTNLYEYVMDWCADAVQHPDRRGQVALVLCGPEGTGKGIFANAMKYLFGQHGLAISNAKHLVGHFNAHLRDTVLLFADEAFYAGDRAHTSILKAIITESEMVVEAQVSERGAGEKLLAHHHGFERAVGGPRLTRQSSLRRHRRRLSKMGNLTYFAAIQHELEHGGYEALLAELLDRVPSSDIRQIPVTDALVTQRKLSLDTTEAWWLDCLHRGYVFTSVLGSGRPLPRVARPDQHGTALQELRSVLPRPRRTPSAEPRTARAMDAHDGGMQADPAGTLDGRRAHHRRHHDRQQLLQPCRRTRLEGSGLRLRDRHLDAARTGFLKATGLTVEWPQGEE